MNTTLIPGPDSTLQEILAAYPGARRTLFRRYHIGGCASCAFDPDETLNELCRRNGGLPPDQVLLQIQAGHEEESKLLIEPRDLAAELAQGAKVRLLDLRPRDEWETARIDGSELLSQDRLPEILGTWNRATPFVILDHLGRESLDAAAYFAGHGFTSVRALRGGIDAWSTEVNPAVPRYRLE